MHFTAVQNQELCNVLLNHNEQEGKILCSYISKVTLISMCVLTVKKMQLGNNILQINFCHAYLAFEKNN